MLNANSLLFLSLSLCALSVPVNAQTNKKEFVITLHENSPALNSKVSYQYECMAHNLAFSYSTQRLRASKLESLSIDDTNMRDKELGQGLDRAIAYIKAPIVVGVTCSDEGFTLLMSTQGSFDPKTVDENHVAIRLPFVRK